MRVAGRTFDGLTMSWYSCSSSWKKIGNFAAGCPLSTLLRQRWMTGDWGGDRNHLPTEDRNGRGSRCCLLTASRNSCLSKDCLPPPSQRHIFRYFISWRDNCKRPILRLASSKILTPHPPHHPASVYPPPLWCGGRTHSLVGEGGWGQYFGRRQTQLCYLHMYVLCVLYAL